MNRTLDTIAIITIIAYLGIIINIGGSYCVYWQQMDPLLFMKDFEEKFPLLVPGALVTLLPGVVLSFILIFKNKHIKKAKNAWLLSFICLLLVNVITIGYHLPVNFNFMSQSYTPEIAIEKLQIWVMLHWVRILLTLVASIYAVNAFKASIINEKPAHTS